MLLIGIAVGKHNTKYALFDIICMSSQCPLRVNFRIQRYIKRFKKNVSLSPWSNKGLKGKNKNMSLKKCKVTLNYVHSPCNIFFCFYKPSASQNNNKNYYYYY